MNAFELFTLKTMQFTTDTGLVDIIKSAKSNINSVVGAVVGVLGAILVAYGVFQVWKNLTSNQPGSWVKAIACILIGGFMMAGSYSTITDTASAGNDTINSIAKGQNASSTVLLSEDAHSPHIHIPEK